VGGKVPGSLPTDARTIYEEGVSVPPIKIIKAGVMQDDLLKVILHNCRLPTWNFSDFNAIAAALRTAAIRCVEISTRFGDDVFYSAMDAMLERNKRAMRQLIRQTVPEKKQYFEDYICDDGLNMGPYKIACTMWREGDRCIFDFTGTDPQSISSINFLLNEEMFKMFAGVYMIMVFDPQILFNDGFYDLMEVRIPPGTLLKPLKPAALSCRTHALGRIFDILGGLLGQGNPAFMCAAGFSDSPHFMYSGYKSTGEWSSCTRSRSAASRASPSATDRTGTRCGRRSPTCRTSSSRATFRCASTSTRPLRTPAARARIAAVTACASVTASSSRARSRSTTIAG
jgi:N-methylhydantoinase B